MEAYAVFAVKKKLIRKAIASRKASTSCISRSCFASWIWRSTIMSGKNAHFSFFFSLTFKWHFFFYFLSSLFFKDSTNSYFLLEHYLPEGEGSERELVLLHRQRASLDPGRAEEMFISNIMSLVEYGTHYVTATMVSSTKKSISFSFLWHSSAAWKYRPHDR